MLSFINETVKPDFLIWGGDSVPHNVESQSAEDNINVIMNATKQITNALPETKTYVTIGNHDTYP